MPNATTPDPYVQRRRAKGVELEAEIAPDDGLETLALGLDEGARL